MLKKTFILLFSANLFAVEYQTNPELSLRDTSIKVIGIGVASLVAYSVLPKLLEDACIDSRLGVIAGAAVGAYGLTQIYIVG